MSDSDTSQDGLADSAPPIGWMPRATSSQALVGAPILNTPASSAAATSPIVGGSGGGIAPPATVAPSPLAGSPDKFLVQRESGGKYDATNSASGAYGLGQFTADTAKTVLARHPELPSLSDFYSKDPAIAVPAQQAYIHAHAIDQAKVLTANGLDATPGNIHMNWFLGETGGPRFLKAMQANPNVAAITLARPEQVAANKGVFFGPGGVPRTASEVYGAINGGASGGTSSGGMVPPAASAAPSVASNPAGVFRDEMKLKLLQGMFPQHGITQVEYDPWKYVTKPSGPVDVNRGVS